jgi:hypothetical protein
LHVGGEAISLGLYVERRQARSDSVVLQRYRRAE